MSLSPHIEALLQDLRERLEVLCGGRLHQVVLYGSYTRGEETPTSDVDVMVVLEGDPSLKRNTSGTKQYCERAVY